MYYVVGIFAIMYQNFEIIIHIVSKGKKNSMCVTIGGINNSIMHTPTPYQIVFCGFEKEREMGVLQRPILCLQITLQVGLVQRQIFMLQHIPTTR